MKVLFCGSRYFSNYNLIYKVMRAAKNVHGQFTVIHGGAPGADTLAGMAAEELGLECEVHEADWKGRGNRAGPERNQRMADARPHRAYVFRVSDRDSRGTHDMMKRLRAAGIPYVCFNQG